MSCNTVEIEIASAETSPVSL